MNVCVVPRVTRGAAAAQKRSLRAGLILILALLARSSKLEASIAIARVQNQQTFLCEFVLEQLELTVDLGSEEAQGAEYSSQKRRRLRGSVCARFGACSQC